MPAGSQVTVNSSDIANPTFLQMLANLGKFIMNAFVPAKTANNEKVYVPQDAIPDTSFTGEKVVTLKKDVQTYKSELRETTEPVHSQELTKMALSEANQKNPSIRKNDCTDNNGKLSEASKSSGWSQFIERFERTAAKSNINPKAIAKTLAFMKNASPSQQQGIKNRRFVTISDMSIRSSQKRMAVLDLETNQVSYHYVAHGEGKPRGGPNDGDFLKSCSNSNGSYQTPPGFHTIDQPYVGRWGNSLRMTGLESRNNISAKRSVVMHAMGTDSDNQYFIKRDGRFSLTQGCPAVTEEDYVSLKPKLKGGSLYYNFCPQDW
ncbi:hypothetical protein D3C87_1385990 [compost metagenome]